MLDLSLATLIKARRNEMGYSITELFDITGFDENVIRAIEDERSDVIVALHVLKQLAMALGIPFRVLLEKI
jgi:transcriptional regulator with XRE-family HTH domain